MIKKLNEQATAFCKKYDNSKLFYPTYNFTVLYNWQIIIINMSHAFKTKGEKATIQH